MSSKRFKKILCLVGCVASLQVAWAEVILINQFKITPEKELAFVAAWHKGNDVLSKCEGYVSTKLHKSIQTPGTWINYAVWSSREAFQRAVSSLEFKKSVLEIRAQGATGSPELFEVHFSSAKP